MTQKRLKTEIRQESILNTALLLATCRGYMNITRDEIADLAKLSGTTVQYHFKTMANLRTQLMRYAIIKRNPVVVAQGLSVKDPQALKADDELKRLAIESMV